MNKDLKAIDQLCQISGAIIKSPHLSLKDFGIINNSKNNILIYTGEATKVAGFLYPAVTSGITAFAGTAVITGASTLSTIGIVAGGAAAGALAAASTSAATGVGIGIASAIVIGSAFYYKKKKKEKEEKERLHREVIRKQQAAIQKLKEVNIELEKKMRCQQSENEQLKSDIKRLQEEINNLNELIEVLAKQNNEFKNAA